MVCSSCLSVGRLPPYLQVLDRQIPSSATWGPTIGCHHLSKDTSVAAGQWPLASQIFQAPRKYEGLGGPVVWWVSSDVFFFKVNWSEFPK